MSAQNQLRLIVMVAAGDPEWGDNRKTMIARAARRLGISERRAKSLFYGESMPRFDEGIELARRARELQEATQRRRERRDERNAAIARLCGPDLRPDFGLGLLDRDQEG